MGSVRLKAKPYIVLGLLNSQSDTGKETPSETLIMSRRSRQYSLDGWVPEAQAGEGDGMRKGVTEPASKSGVGRG